VDECKPLGTGLFVLKATIPADVVLPTEGQIKSSFGARFGPLEKDAVGILRKSRAITIKFKDHATAAAARKHAETKKRSLFGQGLTLVHFSAQLERFLWDRVCVQGLCSP